MVNCVDLKSFPPPQYQNNLQLTKPCRASEPVHEEPNYPGNLSVYGSVKEGDHVDIVSLLSTNYRDFLIRNNGEKVMVESLKGKYVMIFCFFLPVETHSAVDNHCWAIKAAFSEWFDYGRDDIQMVMVAKMKRGFVDNEESFIQFFSTFPNCLAIPFHDSKSHDYVCKSLGLDGPGVQYSPSAIVLDPLHKILQESSFFLELYGADSFPFTNERFETLYEEEHRPLLPLEEILRCKPSDFLICNTGEHGNKIRVSDLKNKLVAIYLCRYGDFMDELNEIHNLCCTNRGNYDMEIVLVYLPHEEPQQFIARINDNLEQRGISCWWVLPFKDSVSHWLSRLSESNSSMDTLIILDPTSGRYVNPHGEIVMNFFGIDGYPFTIEAMIEKETARLRTLTLDSLLVLSDEQNYVCTNDGTRVSVEDLRGRNILLYLEWTHDSIDDPIETSYNLIKDLYHKIKEYKDPNFEVVFVPMDFSENISSPLECFTAMPWLECPHDPARADLIWDHICMKGSNKFNDLIAFGKDGQILTIHALQLLMDRGFDAYPFPNCLNQDVEIEFKWFLDSYDDHHYLCN
ncbi:probable nucleoredoxin 1 [Spinacia oleracea]|uniref:Probable nucleoredoxin 1 n=1 Tax=Spinacia oleracea TaxID=3562 RepID=A0A9R0K9D5_SPIOL|nr:probable nucleoredoxin 1 [Spinacia oleracea]